MKLVERYDRGELRKAVKTDEGYYLVEGFVARPGIYEYRRQDGSIERELVLPDELHRADSLATLPRKPVTLEHPPEFVSPDNIEKYGVGDADGEVEVEAMGGFVRVKMAVRRKDGIAALDQGIRELSPGYVCDLEDAPGVHPKWGSYDAIQRNRRYNHIAITRAGRAGPEVHLRTDSAMQVAPFNDHKSPRGYTMEDVKNAVQTEMERRDAQSKMDKLQAENDSLKKKLDELTGKLDAMHAEKEQAKKDAEKENEDAGKDPKNPASKNDGAFDRIAWFEQRQDALRVAQSLGVVVEDKADIADIQRAVVQAKLGAGYRADASSDYIAAAYDMIAVQAQERDQKYQSIGNSLMGNQTAPAPHQPTQHQDSAMPEDAFIANLNRAFNGR